MNEIIDGTIEMENDSIFKTIPRVLVKSGERWIKHVYCNGARFHVLRWVGHNDGTAECRCSEPDCIYNKDDSVPSPQTPPLTPIAGMERKNRK